MRITGGTYGGRTLTTPEDRRVRPTADKVRQAIYNILRYHAFDGGFTLAGARAIDLFAGTGALGLEALSQGAVYCLFVDDDADSRALVRENVEKLQLTGVSKIWRRNATDLGPVGTGAGGPFSLAFLDPPYRKDLVGPALTSLLAGGWLTPGAVAVVETAAEENLPPTDGFTLCDERVYGETRVLFLERI